MTIEPVGESGSGADELRELLETIVEAMAIDGEVSVTVAEETLTGSVEGPNLANLIGRGGQTIDAIQHLAQKIVVRVAGPMRVVVDAGGYRARRETALHGAADRVAEEALREKRPAMLEAMTASDRRVVHEHLRERGGVETYSEGDEPARRVVVVPAGL